MDFMEFGRAALACYFTFIALYYTAKLMALRARTGVSHADFGGPGTSQYVSHRLFRAFRVAIWLLCVVRVFRPEVDRLLGPIEPLMGIGPLALGLSLLLVSLGLVVYLHSYMGEAWRSAVGPDDPKVLITDGPFGHMRHPLFTAIGIGQVGFFLALPSVFSLVCLAVGIAVLVVQARFEERRLASAFGPAWAAYARAVPALSVWPNFGRAAPRAGGQTGLGPAAGAGPVSTGSSSREPHSAHDPS
jgi:protein-S-isoprenylcysteine O-methyltransferase Ste14